MPSQLAVGDIKVALNRRLFPAITTWNRLEARPRSQNFERALRAEIRDALWMLSKQWQMGEFRGSDSGSPAFAKLLMATTRLTKYRPAGGATQLFDASIPLETKVERRPVPLHRQQRILGEVLEIAAASGIANQIGRASEQHRKAFGARFGADGLAYSTSQISIPARS